MSARVPSLLREPLLLFLLAGALLFALDAGVAGGSRPVIEVPQGRLAQARAQLRQSLGRAPDEAELRARMEGWIEQELLYREALAQDLGRGDPIIRRRLAQKMQLLLEQQVTAQPPDDKQLRALLAEHPQRYATPARYSFEHRFFSRERHGDGAMPTAAAALPALQSQTDEPTIAADKFFAGTRLQALTTQQIRKLFGAEFADALPQLPTTGWQGPLKSGYGAHLLRVTRVASGRPAEFATVRDQLRRDWLEQRRQQLRRDTLDGLRQRYRIEMPGS